MVTSIVNSLGYGSGIDVSALVTKLAAASRDPKVARFDTRATAVQTSISAVGQARSDLEGFTTSLATLVAGGSLQSQPSVSDSSIVDAKAQVGARMSSFSGEIEVTQLARGQTLASGYVTAAGDPVGQGTMTLTVGSTPYTITIGSSNDSLTGLAAAINGAGAGVTANVVTDSSGSRLVLKGPTGTPSAFTLSSSDAGLTNFTHPGAMTLVQAAQNATVKVDGLTYSRPSNSIGDIIPGVTLTLKKVAVGSPVSVSTTRAGDALKTTMADFVSVYNELKGHIDAAQTATRNDQALASLERQLGQLLSKSVTSEAPSSLSAIGIKTNRDGTIAFDSVAFDRAYAANPDAVEAIFSPTRDTTHTAATDPGISGALAALKSAVTATDGPLTSLSTRLTKEASAIAKDREKMEARETAYKARLDKQFGGLDASVGTLKATQSYLDQQIKIWTASK
ncbi:MAG: flagellar filament capping protein FliD [Sphingomonadales bacterium]